MFAVCFTFVNLITTLRVIIGTGILVNGIENISLKVLLILLVLAIASDFFDGVFARKLGCQTKFGKVYDVIADKVFTSCIFLSIGLQDSFVMTISIIMILQFIALSIAAIIKKHVSPPSLDAKVAASIWYVAMLIYLFDWEWSLYSVLVFGIVANFRHLYVLIKT